MWEGVPPSHWGGTWGEGRALPLQNDILAGVKIVRFGWILRHILMFQTLEQAYEHRSKVSNDSVVYDSQHLQN